MNERASKVEPLRILLAEDGLANQTLAVGLLEQSKHHVTIVANGKLAVEAWQNDGFDLILMNVQMPELNGLRAAETIRQLEQEGGGRIPIVGVTATPSAEEQKRCLAAGMDDCVAKPLRTQTLNDLFRRIFAQDKATGRPPLDMSHGLEAAGGSEELLREVIQIFVDECPGLEDELQRALDSGDHKTVQRTAHTIKGSLRLCPPTPAQELAEEIEQAGCDEQIDAAREKFESLKAALADVMEQLRDYLASG